MCNLPYVIYLDSTISGFATYHYLYDICIVQTFTHIVVFFKLDTTFKISDFQFRRTISRNNGTYVYLALTMLEIFYPFSYITPEQFHQRAEIWHMKRILTDWVRFTVPRFFFK